MMKCLAVNTATKNLSIAITEGEKVLHLFETAEMRDQGNVLLSHIQDGLTRNSLNFLSIDLLAVVTGPGSFTGIRIGLATMRGIAMAADKPLIGISSFEMFAASEPGAANIVAVESWRDELYFAVLDDERRALTECMNETPEAFYQRFQQIYKARQKIIISGDARKALAPFFKDALLPDKENNAADVALLAMQKFKTGVSFAKPVPYYLREADVTISAKAVKTLKEQEN